MGEPTIYKPSIYKGDSIYKTGAGESPSSDRPDIPAGFDYIGAIYWKNTINSFTSSGLTILGASNKGKIIQKFYKPDNSKYNGWSSFFRFGSWSDNFSNIQINTYTNTVSAKNNSTNTSITKTFYPGLHEISLEQNKCFIDGQELAITYAEKTGVTACFPFPLLDDRTKPNPVFAMYEFKVIDETDKVIVDFVPVKRIVDNAIGVFDVARGYFYNNSFFDYYNI